MRQLRPSAASSRSSIRRWLATLDSRRDLVARGSQGSRLSPRVLYTLRTLSQLTLEPPQRRLHPSAASSADLVHTARLQLALLEPHGATGRDAATGRRGNEYRRLMEDADRDVLEFVGDQGKTAGQVAERFPAFDLEHLVRAELIRPRRTNPVKTQSRRFAPDPTFYVLTSRGAEAIGLDQYTLHSD
jgi:hypothetical protein